MYRQRHEEAFNGRTKLDQLKLIVKLQPRSSQEKRSVSQGPLPPGLASLPGFFWSGSNFDARGNVDFQTRKVTVPPVLYVRAMPNRSSWLHIITCIV